MLAAKTIFRRT